MIRKFINTTLTIACIVGSVMIGHDLYIHRREDFYITICVISGVMVMLYLSGEFEIFKNIMESIAWSSSNGNFSLEMPDDIFTEAKQSGRARETICRALRSLDYTVSNMYPPSHHNKFQISW